ncbi:MAG: peptide deformylase [SAR324 cluster bacterium]
MAVLTVHRFPDPVLKRRALPVAAFDAALKRLAGEMLETMYVEGGIGLAAVQVGELRRLVVMDLMNGEELDGKPAPHQPRVFVNPEILQAEGEITTEEGCLSVVDFHAEVTRAARVECAYRSLTGEPKREWLEGIAAVCIQHEIDHLNGKLFIDHLPLLKREMVKKRLAKMRRAEGEALPDDVRIVKRGAASKQARAL